jgi:hypothetical protein
VTLEVTATGLNVDIINGPARSAPLELDGCGGDAGLLGMTERVKAHGGQLSAGPVPGGSWRIAASPTSGTHLGLLRAENAQAVMVPEGAKTAGGWLRIRFGRRSPVVSAPGGLPMNAGSALSY